MTAIDDRLATVTPLRRKPPAVEPVDDRARLLAESNRVLDTHLSTEMSARDALGELVGALIGAAGNGLNERALVRVVGCAADRLGCPPVDAPRAVREAFALARVELDVAALVAAFMDAEDLLSKIVTAVGDVKTFEGTSRSESLEAGLHSLVEDLAAEYSIGVTR